MFSSPFGIDLAKFKLSKTPYNEPPPPPSEMEGICKYLLWRWRWRNESRTEKLKKRETKNMNIFIRSPTTTRRCSLGFPFSVGAKNLQFILLLLLLIFIIHCKFLSIDDADDDVVRRRQEARYNCVCAHNWEILRIFGGICDRMDGCHGRSAGEDDHFELL